ncbi:MAG: acyl--CoA ligase [Clostridiales bacterium]|nr:acyl--CoA ligase [Clostridiales bacterium]
MKTPSAERFRKYTSDEVFDRIRNYDSVSAMWKAILPGYAGATAISDNGENYSFAKLEEDAASFRPLVSGLPGDRIGILIPNSYSFVKVYLAVVTAGKTAVILPPQLPPEAVFGIGMKFGLSALVYDAATAEKTALLAARAPQVALISDVEVSDSPAPAADVSGDAPCVVMFTGGTTGKSKGAVLSNRAVMRGTVNGCYGIKEIFGQRYLLVLPFSHVFGLIRNLMTSLYTGSALFINRNSKDLFRDIAVFRPTFLVVVPALAEMALTLSKKFGKNMLGPDMKTIICGAAAVPPYLIREYAAMGIDLLAGYGLTESANLVSGNPESLRKPESVGLMYPGQEYRIEDGELWLKGENMMDGYIGEDDSSSEDGWFRTGDLVKIDDEGFLYITGRTKEIIILPNGENLSPAEVEAEFSALPLVQDCELYEDKAENGTPILVLEVLPRMTELGKLPEAERSARLAADIAAVNASLPSYKRFNRLVVRDSDFPRTPSMKILRHARYAK